MNVNRKLFLTLTASLASAAACSSEKSTTVDAGVDATTVEGDAGAADSGTETDTGAPMDTGVTTDGGPGDTDAGTVDAGWPPPLGDGGVTGACAAFTCEIGELECFAAYSTALKPSINAALYDCASAQCTLEDEYDRTCLTAALTLAPAPTDPIALCAPMTKCPEGTITVSECEDVLGSLSEDGLTSFSEYLGESPLGCNTTEGLAYQVAYWASTLVVK